MDISTSRLANFACKTSFFSLFLMPKSAFCLAALFAATEKEVDISKIEDTPKTENKAIAFNSRLEIGGDYTYVSFSPNGFQSFQGSLGGAQASYEYRPLNRFYGGGSFAWKEGTTHGDAGKRSLLYFDVQERLGYTFGNKKNDIRFTLFSGFGYHYLGQHYDPKEGSSMTFNYNEFYVPVGFLADFDVNFWFALGANFTWMPQVFPTVALSPTKGTHWNLSHTINNFHVEMPFTFTLSKSKRFLLEISPFYEHWEDGHTTAKLSTGTKLGLPGNTYDYYGVNANFGFCF